MCLCMKLSRQSLCLYWEKEIQETKIGSNYYFIKIVLQRIAQVYVVLCGLE